MYYFNTKFKQNLKPIRRHAHEVNVKLIFCRLYSDNLDYQGR